MNYPELLLIAVHILVLCWIVKEIRAVWDDGQWHVRILLGGLLLLVLGAVITSFFWRGYFLNGQVPPTMIALKKYIDR